MLPPYSRIITLAAGIALTGCAIELRPGNYVRTDGRPIADAQANAALAQCQAEGKNAVSDRVNTPGPVAWVTAMATRPSDETVAVNGCMARNGYVTRQ